LAPFCYERQNFHLQISGVLKFIDQNPCKLRGYVTQNLGPIPQKTQGMVDDIGEINEARFSDTFPVILRHRHSDVTAVDGIPDRLTFQTHSQLREIVKIRKVQVVTVILRADCRNVLLKFFVVGGQNLEALLIAVDEITERPENIVEAKRVDRADIVVAVVIRLEMHLYSGFDLVNRRIGVSDARDASRGAAHFVYNTHHF
jgi:hypothetical protein